MNFQQLQNQVAYWVDDLKFGYFTPIQVQQFINNAQRQVQKYLVDAGQNWYLTVAQTTLVINQPDYYLPSDLMNINRLEIVVSGFPPNEYTEKLQQITLNQQDVYPFTVDTPQGYYLRKSKLVLVPAPATPLILRCSYTYKVSDMVLDSDLPDVPDQFHEFIAVLATIDCLSKDGRESQTFMNKKEEYLRTLKENADKRQQDGPRMVVNTSDGGLGVLF